VASPVAGPFSFSDLDATDPPETHRPADSGVLHRILASFHIAAILCRQVVVRFVDKGIAMRRIDTILIVALIVISSALVILLAVGEFLG
jgi:hypothetical protein